MQNNNSGYSQDLLHCKSRGAVAPLDTGRQEHAKQDTRQQQDNKTQETRYDTRH